ncbi:hypothetical protein VM1G_01235 [Cytospora mali]|uniref:Uncharacterized protein n=1 Tax=Cytospora mali TaxID=578113 RepID=A0A194VN09_CYTMA|nr:hypothetical protein VM1G_01235 [Valsa mali]
MDRIRDFASRSHRASFPSSHPIALAAVQPNRSSHTISQAQARPASDTKAYKSRAKSGTKKNKAIMRRASVERREADQKLFDMVETTISQNEAISNHGLQLSLRLNEVARDIIETNRFIERKDEEIADITKKLKIMEDNFNEAVKLLDYAKQIATQAVHSGCLAQCKCNMEAQLIENIASMTHVVETEKVDTWSVEKTNGYLSDLRSTYFANEDTIASCSVARGILFLAKHFLFHGKYDDEYAPMLFHLVNGHDYKDFVHRSREVDHQAASGFQVKYLYKGTALQPQPDNKSAAGNHKGKGKEVTSTKESGDITDKPSSSVAIKRIFPPGCHCEELERGKFEDWLAKLRSSLRHSSGKTAEMYKKAFHEAIDGITKAAEGLGIKVTATVPVIEFMCEKNGQYLKSPAVLKRLQASAEKFGFYLGATNEDSKIGYHIIAKDMVNEEFHESIKKQMQFTEEVKELTSIRLDETMEEIGETDQNLRATFMNAMEAHSADYWNKNLNRFMLQHGCTVSSVTPELLHRFVIECMAAGKAGILRMAKMKADEEHAKTRARKKKAPKTK